MNMVLWETGRDFPSAGIQKGKTPEQSWVLAGEPRAGQAGWEQMVEAEVGICVTPEWGLVLPAHTHSLGLGFAFGALLRKGQEEAGRGAVFDLTW